MNDLSQKDAAMKHITLLLISFTLFSCQQANNKNRTSNDVSAHDPIGGAKDQYGCLVSAGYTWSKMREECIRPWEGTIALNVTDTSTNFETAAFVLVDSAKQKAELFLKEEDESILLDSIAPDLYANEHYKLIEENHCWSLIHQEEVLYEEKK